jgi:hypothetical protein
MSVRLQALYPVLLIGALFAGACESNGVAGSPGEPRLGVMLSDAPADLAEANVKIQKIVLIRSESGEGDASSRVELTPKSTDWIDLLTLANGKVQELANETIEPGSYRQVRLVVCEMYIETKAGQVIASADATLPAGVTAAPGAELKLPSQCKSGFKVKLADGEVAVEGGTNTLVIDFDVQRSFAREAGRSGKWIVTPTLHGVKRERGATISGTVALQNVTLPVACGGESLAQGALLQRFVPTATAGTTVRSGSTSAQGAFSISHVAPGSYALAADTAVFANGDKLAFTAAATPATVTTTAGGSATAAYSVSATTCIKA